MARRIRITWDKIRIHKSEDYQGGFAGIGGEPGGSAEWRVVMRPFVNGVRPKAASLAHWELDGVKDGSVHVIDKDVDVELTGPLQVQFSGEERDDLFKHDSLPNGSFEHAPEAGWDGVGSSHKQRMRSRDYEYTVYYTIRYLDPPPPVKITPGQGTLRTARYSGMWNAGSERIEWFIDLTADQLQQRAAWLWGKGGRLRQLQPVVRGGEVRYNSLWDYSGIGQLWNINCDENHFRKTTDENWNWARPHSVIPFVHNGQVRYACLWNQGQHGQLWHPNTDEAGFTAHTGDTWSWARPHQVYAFVVGGKLRYSCLWNAGQHAQRWHPNCSATQASKIGDESWSWARAHQIQPFYVGDELRYSILWNADQRGQLWNIDCNDATIRKNMKDTESWARPAQIYEAA
jgi:hypothetical protein